MTFDLVIVGGGFVGAGLAAALAQSSTLRIALVDARLPTQQDPRLFALSSSSCQFLTNLTLWPTLQTHAAPIHAVHVSRKKHFGTVRLRSEELGMKTLGHVIPAYQIETALNTLIANYPITFFRPATLSSMTQQDGQATLTLETDKGTVVLTTRLVIAADGTESTIRKQLQIPTEVIDYKQSAIVTRTQLQRSHQQIAYERFTESGAIAMLPLVGDECATIWSADNDTVKQLQTLSDADFLAALQLEFGYRLGRLQAIKQRHMFPLRMVRAHKKVEQCVYLLGNAAHTLHPIAAQGFNLAIYEVAVLVEKITAAEQVPSALELQAIPTLSAKQETLSLTVSHRLAQWFTDSSMLKSILTQAGMLTLNAATPLKKFFMQNMLGKGGRVPRLLLPQINEPVL